MPSKRVTLRDLAAKAGLSHVAVSLALRNHPRVSAATRARVQALAAKLGYRPNAYVSALMSEVRTQRVAGQPILALINAWPVRAALRERLFQRQILIGVERRAAELGFGTEEFWTREPGMTDARLSKVLRARGIDGVVVLGMPEAHGALALDWPQFAGAACGTSLYSPIIHRATPALYRAMMLALEKVRAAGCKRVGLALTPEIDARNEHVWKAAFLGEQHGRPARERIPPIFVGDGNRDAFLRWVERHQPDAVVTSLIFLPKLPAWLRSAGIGVPRDLALVTLYESERHAGTARVDSSAEHIGATAVDLVVAQLHRNERGLPSFRKDVLIAPTWVPGGTLREKPAS